MKEQSVMGERFLGIDIVRTIAIFSVIAGHFWVLNTPYCKVDFDGSFPCLCRGWDTSSLQLVFLYSC